MSKSWRDAATLIVIARDATKNSKFDYKVRKLIRKLMEIIINLMDLIKNSIKFNILIKFLYFFNIMFELN